MILIGSPGDEESYSRHRGWKVQGGQWKELRLVDCRAWWGVVEAETRPSWEEPPLARGASPGQQAQEGLWVVKKPDPGWTLGRGL